MRKKERKTYDKRNWICNCMPPIPDLMSPDDNKCEVCKMKKPTETNYKSIKKQ